MTKKYKRDLTESSDFYSATEDKWAEYWQAWDDNDIDKVERMEMGEDPDFYYDP